MPGPLVRASIGITDEANSGTISSVQGDHLSGKPGIVREFDSKEMSGILPKIREMSGKKSCQGNVA